MIHYIGILLVCKHISILRDSMKHTILVNFVLPINACITRKFSRSYKQRPSSKKIHYNSFLVQLHVTVAYGTGITYIFLHKYHNCGPVFANIYVYPIMF